MGLKKNYIKNCNKLIISVCVCVYEVYIIYYFYSNNNQHVLWSRFMEHF